MKVLLVLILPIVLTATVQPVSRQQNGQAFYFDVSAVKKSDTACGKPYKDTDLVAIINSKSFQSRGNAEHKICGQKILVKNIQNGKTVVVEIQDKSKDIKHINDIGLTKAGLLALGILDPTKVTQLNALQNAASIGSLMISTEYMLAP